MMHPSEVQHVAQESPQPPVALPSDDLRKFQLTQRAREEVLEMVRSILQEKSGDPAVQSALSSVTGIMSIESLRGIPDQNVIQTYYSPHDRPFVLHAAIDIAKRKPELLDKLVSCTEERDANLFARLVGIARIVEETFIRIAKDILGHDAEKDAMETREALMKHGDRLFPLVKHLFPPADTVHTAIGGADSLAQAKEKDADTNTPTFVHSILAAEECLCQQYDTVARGNDEYLDRISLFRKLTANMRRNANIFRGSGMNFRMNQLNAVMALVHFLQHGGHGDRIGYFKQPTGAGKTILFGIIARLMVVKTLILVPRTNLLIQTHNKLIDRVGFPTEDICICGDRSSMPDRPITITTYQSHVARMSDDQQYRDMVKTCELIICDEAHRSLGSQTQDSIQQLDGEFDEEMTAQDEELQEMVLEHIDRYASKAALKIGFTATPELVDKSVKKSYKELIAETTYSELVRAHVIKKFKVRQVYATVKPNEVSGARIGAQKEVEMLHREHVYTSLIQAYKDAKSEVDERLYPLASCATIGECDVFSGIAESMGVSCVIVTGREYSKNPGVDHQKIAEDMLLEGTREIIVTVDKLKEGWDFPPLNAVLLARATLSSANILQPAGRASRIFQDQKFAYIFEPSWHPIRLNDSTRNPDAEPSTPDTESSQRNFSFDYKRPLTFADALYLCGEKNISDVCEGWHGESLPFKKIYHLKNNGQVEIDGILCVGLYRYAGFRSINGERLTKYVHEENLVPIGKARSGFITVEVYRKGEIDRIIANKFPGTLDGEGRVTIQETVCVGLRRFAEKFRFSHSMLADEVADTGLRPLGSAISGVHTVPVYAEEAIMALPVVRAMQSIVRDDGTVIIDHCLGIAVSAYAAYHEIPDSTLLKAITSAGLVPIGKARSKSGIVHAYRKEEVDRLDYFKRLHLDIQDSGETDINGVPCILPRPFALCYGMIPFTLSTKIKEAGIQALGTVAVGETNFPMQAYPKAAVLKISYVFHKLFTPNEHGEYDVEGEVFSSIIDYAKKNGLNYQTLREELSQAGIKAAYHARRGNKDVDLFSVIQLNALECAKIASRTIGDTGTIDIDGTECMTLRKLEEMTGVKYWALCQAVKDANLEPYGQARSKNASVRVYARHALLALDCVRSIQKK